LAYGSGGVPFEGRDILAKVNEMIESGIVVVITTQCLHFRFQPRVELEQAHVRAK
jgi:L-asparaginase/Glu-tRNA(Gln) amidotransferase subunit D